MALPIHLLHVLGMYILLTTVGGVDVKAKPVKTIGLKHAQAHVATSVKDHYSPTKFEHNSQGDPEIMYETNDSDFNKCCNPCFKEWTGRSKCKEKMKSCSGDWTKCNFKVVRRSLFCSGLRFITWNDKPCNSMNRRKIKWKGLQLIFEQELKNQNRYRRFDVNSTPLPGFTDSEFEGPFFPPEIDPSSVEVYKVKHKYGHAIANALKILKSYPDYRRSDGRLIGNNWRRGKEREPIPVYFFF